MLSSLRHTGDTILKMKWESEDCRSKQFMPEADRTGMSDVWRLQTVVRKECTITTAFLVVESSGSKRK